MHKTYKGKIRVRAGLADRALGISIGVGIGLVAVPLATGVGLYQLAKCGWKCGPVVKAGRTMLATLVASGIAALREKAQRP